MMEEYFNTLLQETERRMAARKNPLFKNVKLFK